MHSCVVCRFYQGRPLLPRSAVSHCVEINSQILQEGLKHLLILLCLAEDDSRYVLNCIHASPLWNLFASTPRHKSDADTREPHTERSVNRPGVGCYSPVVSGGLSVSVRVKRWQQGKEAETGGMCTPLPVRGPNCCVPAGTVGSFSPPRFRLHSLSLSLSPSPQAFFPFFIFFATLLTCDSYLNFQAIKRWG